MNQQILPRVTISLDALLHNVAVIRDFLPSTTGIIAVVKDASYGCGAFVIAKTLSAHAGISFFAVATADEALALRQQGCNGDILIFGKVPERQLAAVLNAECLLTLSSLDDLTHWKTVQQPIRFHAEIDTGMHRLGLLPEEIAPCISSLAKLPHCIMDGIFTHMASADVPDTTSVATQLALFRSVKSQFQENNMHPRCVHVANSAATMRFPNSSFTHVRPGIALYGCQPDPAQQFSRSLRPVLSLSGRVVALRKVSAGAAVSYGGHYVTSEPTTIATIGIGYGQGIPRYLSSCGSVLIGGKKYRIAGNVTMDYCMVDAGAVPCMHTGDEAVFIGSQQDHSITPDDIALLGNTIGYEVLCNISPTIEHCYIKDGDVVYRSPVSSF